MAKISIVMPVYNEESSIEEVIAKVLSVPLQHEKELIVVDDRSTDRTGEILQGIKQTNNSVFYL